MNTEISYFLNTPSDGYIGITQPLNLYISKYRTPEYPKDFNYRKVMIIISSMYIIDIVHPKDTHTFCTTHIDYSHPFNSRLKISGS